MCQRYTEFEALSFSRAFSNAFSRHLKMVPYTRKTMFLTVFVFVSVSAVDSSPAIPDNSDVLRELGVDLSNQGRMTKYSSKLVFIINIYTFHADKKSLDIIKTYIKTSKSYSVPRRLESISFML